MDKQRAIADIAILENQILALKEGRSKESIVLLEQIEFAFVALKAEVEKEEIKEEKKEGE